jgi:hypothetical protein
MPLQGEENKDSIGIRPFILIYGGLGKCREMAGSALESKAGKCT